MTSETPSLHLIGDNGELQSQEGLMTFFESALAATGSPTNTVSRSGTSHVKRCGTKYHVVAVFGGQSSGKSTLLNNVFGTQFETMEESTGRQQTTKGAFLARYQDREAAGEAEHRNPSELFVMDFEGTDGMERGEDQSFERQLSLFALSVADVLVINMWANDVGRYNAANMSLLRTIFEVNLQLFAHDSYLKEEKPTLLIVLRDFTEVDLQKYADIVMKSLNKTWESITKPEGFENHEITNLFHVRFHGLPHYKLQRADFDEEVKNFRRWFLDTLSPKYLFKSIVSYRHIPLEALPSYFDNCWASIQGSRDLDIPTQRDLVARHRCTELFDAAVAAFKIVTDEQAANIKAGKLQPQLEAALHHAADAATADFDLQTKLYSKKVVADAARKLEVALETGIKDVVEQHTAKLVEECMRHVDDDVQSIVDDAFRQLHSNKKLLEGQATPADALPLVKTFWSDIALRITELEDRLASGNYAEAYGKYSDLVTQDNASLERSAAVVADTIIERVRQRIASMAADACTTMTKAFDFVLTHKEDGSLRFFSTTTGLQTVFPRARFAGLVVLGCIFFMRLKRGLQRTESALGENRDEKRFYLSIPSYQEGDVVVQYPEFSILPKGTDSDEETDGDEKLAGTHVSMIDPKYILMNKAAVRRAFDLYSQQIQFSMQMQLRTIESSQQSAPTWVWVAMLVLGHNEFLYVATSPVLLLFTIIVVYMFFSQWVVAQWHRFEETGPTGVVLAVKSVIALVEPHVRSLQSRAPPKAEADADAAASAKKHD